MINGELRNLPTIKLGQSTANFYRYEGLIRNNRMHGRGSYKWPNGDNYFGEYHEGLRNGYGEMIYQSKNEKYAGRWQDGLYHGQGQYW